jgi:hydrogenase expression/formation protein HypE
MDEERIVIAHGGGGALTRELVEGVIVPALGGAPDALPDAAPVPGAADIFFTTDAFVVKPLFFRGGDIGKLAVHGVVNDLAVSGAEPLALSLSLIIEEGFPISDLRRVLESIGEASRACGVPVITGDTKVVARGEADQLFVTAAGVGRRRITVSPAGLKEGDVVLVSGPLAEHGVAVMSERKGIAFDTPVRSDTASVWPLVRGLIDAEIEIHAMRDPTRGGFAACCVELADSSGVTIEIEESAVPVRPAVRAACEMLGLDPMTVANEGRLVALVPAKDGERALHVLRGLPDAGDACVAGRVVARRATAACLRTRYGGMRIVEMPYGEELPRIC